MQAPEGLAGGLEAMETVVKGDAKVYCIAAASIIAKVVRDTMMVEYDKQYPQYGIAQHKGYGTAKHMAAIARHGACAIHRLSFAPVKGNYRRTTGGDLVKLTNKEKQQWQKQQEEIKKQKKKKKRK